MTHPGESDTRFADVVAQVVTQGRDALLAHDDAAYAALCWLANTTTPATIERAIAGIQRGVKQGYVEEERGRGAVAVLESLRNLYHGARDGG